MSFISAGNTTTTTLLINGDTTGNLVFNTGGANTTALTLTNTQGANFAGSVNAPNTFGFKNRIINGGMAIDQRNSGASVTPANGDYTLDRWKATLTVASKYSVQQSTVAPTGFTNSALITSLSAYSVGASDYFLYQQRIEGYNTADLGWGTAGAKTVTLSFWVRSSLTGTFGGSLFGGSSYSYPFSYTISSANTWEQKSITIVGATSGTWPTTNAIGITLYMNLGTGSTYSGTAGSWVSGSYFAPTGATSVVGTNGATFYITGVQFEVGSQATSFDFRDYGRELILCQRYYYRLKTATAYGTAGSGKAYSTSNGQAIMMAPVSMRTAPSASYSSLANWDSSGVAPIVAMNPISEYSADYRVFTINIQATSFGAGQAVILNSNNNIGSWIDWSAEL